MTPWADRLRPVLTVVAFAIAFGPSVSRADDVRNGGEALITRGIEARRGGDDRAALDLFEQAYALAPSPRAAAQLALAHHALGHWVLAERGLLDALHDASDPWITRYRATLEAALATIAQHLGWLRVETDVTQGELRLADGRHLALPTAERLRVPSGGLAVDASAPGRLPVHRTVEVPSAGEARMILNLELEPRRAAAPPVASPLAPSHDAESTGGPPIDAYWALAASGVLAAGGVVAWRVREDNAAAYDDDSRCLMGTQARAQRCGGALETANVALGAEIGAFGASLAAVVFGIWRLSSASGSHRVGSIATPCAPIMGFGMACGGRF